MSVIALKPQMCQAWLRSPALAFQEDESLRAMEQELDDDLCVLNLHHLVLVGRIARQLVSQLFPHGKPALRTGLHHEGASRAAEDKHILRMADRNGLYSIQSAQRHTCTGTGQNSLDPCLHLSSCLT